MTSLLDLQAQANAAIELLSQIDPEDTDSLTLLEEQVSLLAADCAAKVDNWYIFMKRMEAEEAFNREIAAEHAGRAQSIRNFLDRAKKRLVEGNMIGLLPDKMEGKSKTIRFQKNSQPSVRTDEELNLWDLECDKKWHRFVKTTVELDKEEVLRAYRAGEELPPGVIVTEGKHVRFGIKK